MTPTILPARRLAPQRFASHPTGIPAIAPGVGGGGGGGAVRALSPYELADRLVQAWGRNERRLGELEALDSGVAADRRRLATTSSGRDLVEAHLARLLARREACVAAARADARLAEELSREWDARHAMRRAVGG